MRWFSKALKSNLNLQRFKVLYICGNYSSILSRLDRRFYDLEIRRAFTVFQLMTIIDEARHSLSPALLTWNRYFPGEYDQKRELVDLIVAKAREHDVVLLFGAKDEEHNNAVALKEYIEHRMETKTR